MVGALWKILTDLPISFGHLGMLFRLHGNCYRNSFM
jgi:hypothetical protein